ncbi:MAG: FecR domain-containing protein [Desulfamplus sp.]|nr:FecR domain-containing protein [Desulfamplus sp.]
MKKQLSNLIMILSVFFSIFLFKEIPCSAEEYAGKLVFSEGTVLFSLDKGNSWANVNPEMEFPEGAYIKVGSDGQAALMLNDRSQIRLSAGSVLYLKKRGSAPDEKVNKSGVLEMFSGKLWFRNKRKGSKPVFETPVISASIRGTEMALDVADDGSSNITVLEGQVRCTNSQGEAIIARGEGVTSKKGEAPIITKLLKPEKSVQWLLLTPDIRGPADENGKITSSIEKNGIETAEKAMELFIQGEDSSLETARNAVKLAPNRASTHVALATILQSKGKFEEALENAEKARTLDPISIPALIRTVELLLGLDKVTQAENLVLSYNNTNKEIADKDVRISMLQGYISLIRLDSKRAEKLFREAIEQKRDLASAYLGLGLALYHQKKTSEGLQNMEKACLLEPLAAYPHNYLAKAQYELGERYEAEIELKRAATLDPNDPTPHMYLATILADTYRPGEGIKSLEKSISLNDNKLMTRSRYLLDQDRASKNISLAWSLTTMGLYEWADAKGDQAVWDDESNSSAYIFRASRAQIMGQVDADTIGDMKRADLLKPVNANTYSSYNDYQNLLETPEIKGNINLSGGTDNTGAGIVNLNGGNSTFAFNGSGGYRTTDGPFEGTGKSYSQGMLSVKKEVAYGHQVLAEARAIKGDTEDNSPWQDSLIQPRDINVDYNTFSGSIGYHWRQGAGRDLMALVQGEKKDTGIDEFAYKYMNPVYGTIFNHKNSSKDGEIFRSEIVELFQFTNQNFGKHTFTFGISQSINSSSLSLKDESFFDQNDLKPYYSDKSNSDNPEKREGKIFIRDIWEFSEGFKFDVGIAWCNLENIFLSEDYKNYETTTQNKFEDKNELLPHIGFMWQISLSDTIRAGYFKESEPEYLGGTLQPVEMAGFSKIFGSDQGTFTDFYGVGWDRQWSSNLFTRAEISHRDREFPGMFASHAGNDGIATEVKNRFWYKETQDIARFTFEYLITDQLAMALTYQFTDHNTESGDDRNRIDNDFGATFTWVHPAGWRLQNTWWYMNQKEKSGYLNPVDEDFIIASISGEKSLLDKKLLLVAKWENIFDEEYTYLISDTTESTQLPWQGSYGLIALQWNF